MLSSTLGGSFMRYKIYTAECKISLIEEYQSRNVSMRTFCKEKDISLSTFASWLSATANLAGYDDLVNKGTKIQRCFAHIRRKFYDIVKVLSDEQKKISAANEMVKRIDRLFAIEAKIKADKKSPIETKKIRQSDEYMKIVNDIYDYLDEINAEEGTPLDAAVKYFKNVEEESKTFLLDGHIPISNNICERAIKPFAIMRRNVLFAKTEKGASISGRIFTIVQTAKANALVVDKYLEYAAKGC